MYGTSQSRNEGYGCQSISRAAKLGMRCGVLELPLLEFAVLSPQGPLRSVRSIGLKRALNFKDRS
jgi:hypothetical protein